MSYHYNPQTNTFSWDQTGTGQNNTSQNNNQQNNTNTQPYRPLKRFNTLTPLQQALWQQYQRGLMPMTKTSTNWLNQMMKTGGYNPDAVNKAFDTSVANPARETYSKYTSPMIGESYQGPGTYWGSERALAQERGATQMEQGLTQQRASLIEQERQAALARQMQAFGMSADMIQQMIGMPLQGTYFDQGQFNPQMAKYFEQLGYQGQGNA